MKVLVVAARDPWPPRRGDQMRAVQVLEALAPRHEVTLLAPRAPAAISPPLPLAGCEPYRFSPWPLRLFSVAAAALVGHPLQQGLFASRDLARRLRRLARDADLVVLQLARLERFAACVGHTPLLVDLIDSLALNVATRAAHDRKWLRGALSAEARRLAASEERLAARAALAVLVGERDRAAIVARRADLSERLMVVPLTTERGPEVAVAASGGSSARPRLLFTGNLGYFPNCDAARWLLEEIWPAIRRRRPECELVLAGDRARRQLAAAARAAGATLVASPASLAGLFADAAVALAPLRCGSGVPVKVLEAWAAGVPVVASPWAAAGVGGEDVSATLEVAQLPEEWASAVDRLLTDADRCRRLVAAGRERLSRLHSVAHVRTAWLTAAERAVRAAAVQGAGGGTGRVK